MKENLKNVRHLQKKLLKIFKFISFFLIKRQNKIITAKLWKKLPLPKKTDELLEENSLRNRINKYIYEKKLENVNKKIEVVINILELIKEIIKAPETDIIRSYFDTKEDVINELDTHILKLTNEDFSKIEDLIILFAPTSDLQEISLDSGWGQQFLIISERFDGAIKDLIGEYNLKPFSNS